MGSRLGLLVLVVALAGCSTASEARTYETPVGALYNFDRVLGEAYFAQSFISDGTTTQINDQRTFRVAPDGPWDDIERAAASGANVRVRHTQVGMPDVEGTLVEVVFVG